MKHAKLLGASTVTALALVLLAGVPAASASISGFETSPHQKVSLRSEVPGTFTLNTSHGTVSCESVALVGGGDPVGDTTTLSMSSYTECDLGPLKANGCKVTFRPGSETSKGQFSGSFDIGPAGCGPIRATLGGYGCELFIGAQSGLPATYANTGSGSSQAVSISVKGAPFIYSTEGLCGKGTHTGTMTTDWQLRASSGGNAVGYRAVAELPAGLTLGSQFNVGWFPATLVGTEQGLFELEAKFGSTLCEGSAYGGTMSNSASAIRITPSYDPCETYGFGSTVAMNGCGYILDASGEAGLDCPAGKSVTITSVYCQVTIPAQTFGGETIYTTSGSNANSTVLADIEAEGVHYSLSGMYCSGSAVDGTLRDSVLLRAEI